MCNDLDLLQKALTEHPDDVVGIYSECIGDFQSYQYTRQNYLDLRERELKANPEDESYYDLEMYIDMNKGEEDFVRRYPMPSSVDINFV